MATKYPKIFQEAYYEMLLLNPKKETSHEECDWTIENWVDFVYERMKNPKMADTAHYQKLLGNFWDAKREEHRNSSEIDKVNEHIRAVFSQYQIKPRGGEEDFWNCVDKVRKKSEEDYQLLLELGTRHDELSGFSEAIPTTQEPNQLAGDFKKNKALDDQQKGVVEDKGLPVQITIARKVPIEMFIHKDDYEDPEDWKKLVNSSIPHIIQTFQKTYECEEEMVAFEGATNDEFDITLTYEDETEGTIQHSSQNK